MTIEQANQYFAALPEGFAPAEELRAALPAAAQQVAYVGVAGTAGKTAAAALTAAVLQAAGFVTGLYRAGCEPLEQRVRINGEPVADALLCAAAETLSRAKPLPRAAAELAAAAACFGAAGCRLAVVELPDAGLAEALSHMPVCVVTSIGPDGVSLVLESTTLTKFLYPFDFTLLVNYDLNGTTASISMTVINEGDVPMPFSFGYHPYFTASALENVDFDIRCKTCSENAKGEQPAAPEKITLTRKEGADNTIRLMTGVEFPMSFTDKGNGHKVTVDADDSFNNGVLWQQDAESFVCMEPWNGWANSVNEEGKHEILEPDEALTSEWTITIEKV